MDRDRDRDRRRDRPDENVQFIGAGESYRPGGGGLRGHGARPHSAFRERSSADTWSAGRGDDLRDDRRDTRRDDRRDDIDSYVPTTSRRAERPRSRSPAGYRRRSRSPGFRGRGGTYPSRARTPPRRFSPRRDDRARSPRRRSRPPYAGRPPSPPIKRGREFSPPSRRSPPRPAKRERLASPDQDRFDRPRSPPRRPYSPPHDPPRGAYRPRSRTPPRRDDRRNTYTDDDWRRRSPSPRPPPSGPASNTTSRRSSPPVHPDRASLAPSLSRSPAYAPPRQQYDMRQPRSPPYRARSPPRRENTPPRQASPPRAFPDRTREISPSRRNGASNIPATQPPTGPGGYRNGNYRRPPPTGPSRGYSETTQMSPPTGPATAPLSMSAHNRTSAPSLLSAPTRPRGAPPGRFDGHPRDFSGPPTPRGRGHHSYHAPPPRSSSYDVREPPPSAPRGGGFGRNESGSAGFEGPRGGGFSRDGPAFRHHNNSSSTTYPRTQRFNNTSQHLFSGEKIVPGGRLLPSGLPQDQEKRMKQLESEAEKLREVIEEKQKSKREVLREWEVRERESEREGLRTELAERHLEKLTEGEDGVGGAAF